MMNISMIAAVAEHNAIGQNNDLLVYLSGDLKRFKQLTSSHSIVMGRKTFESLPNGSLPNRKNIVLTHQQNYSAPGAWVVNSKQQVFELCEGEEEIFVIGGSSVYQIFMPHAHKLYITRVFKEFPEANTFFPTINENEWMSEPPQEELIDPKTNIRYSYLTYYRKPAFLI